MIDELDKRYDQMVDALRDEIPQTALAKILQGAKQKGSSQTGRSKRGLGRLAEGAAPVGRGVWVMFSFFKYVPGSCLTSTVF